jgi:hypothetical protein
MIGCWEYSGDGNIMEGKVVVVEEDVMWTGY